MDGPVKNRNIIATGRLIEYFQISNPSLHQGKGMQKLDLRIFLSRIFLPQKWGLRTRFLCTTGVLLLAGAAFTLLNISFTLQGKAKESIHTRLKDYANLFAHQQEEMMASVATAAAGIAATEEIAMAIEDSNRLALQISVSRIRDKIRQSSNREAAHLQIYLPNGDPLFNTSNSNPLEDLRRTTFELVDETKKHRKPFSGIQLLPSGLYFTSTAPVIREGGGFVGIVEATVSFAELFERLGVNTGFGVALLFNGLQQTSEPGDEESASDPNQNITAITLGLTEIEEIEKIDLVNQGVLHSTGNLYFISRKLIDFRDRGIGRILCFYDGKNEILTSDSAIRNMTLLTIVGVFLLFATLYLNVRRIKDFFIQLQKVLIASHSNDFIEPFITDKVQCLDILNCGHEECPVYKNPAKICYLETGDLAISPQYRNSCIHLNTYKRCEECPVYKLRRGDELMQVQHVVNTMMGLWGNFLDSVGTVLAEMFKKYHSNKPSLNDVSTHLQQLAGLTTYSRDLQGVYVKEEVYSQLQWVFETRFGLMDFNLLEVNTSENRLDAVIDLYDLTGSHLDVFFNCELCRAKRVAEDLNSENNPQLCPYFGIDHTKEVRCCMPMVMGGRVGAVFTFVTSLTTWQTVKLNLGIIKKYLEETAPTLSSLRLLKITKEQALRDPLTQCHNRRFMDEYLGKLEGLHLRNERKIGFIMADLDHFKMVNDEFGHLAGDEVLKQLAVILQQNIRKSDLLIRYGGEEFLIILMEISQDGIAMKIAEKLRKAVDETKLTLPSGGTLRKTISMGVAEFPQDGDQLYRVIKYADVALYQAKEEGRNRVLHFTPEMWDGEDY